MPYEPTTGLAGYNTVEYITPRESSWAESSWAAISRAVMKEGIHPQGVRDYDSGPFPMEKDSEGVNKKESC